MDAKFDFLLDKAIQEQKEFEKLINFKSIVDKGTSVD